MIAATQEIDKTQINTPISPSDLQIKLIFGSQIEHYLEDLSRLLDIYSEWPYLYQSSTLEENKAYLMDRYARHPESIVCLAFKGKKAIGAALGVPLDKAPAHYLKNFPKDEIRSDIFYWGELVVLPDDRRQHVAEEIYTKMGNCIKEEKRYKSICFASLERPADYRLNHLKPKNYSDLTPLWEKLGFKRRDELQSVGKWTVIGETEDSLHPMMYW